MPLRMTDALPLPHADSAVLTSCKTGPLPWVLPGSSVSWVFLPRSERLIILRASLSSLATAEQPSFGVGLARNRASGSDPRAARCDALGPGVQRKHGPHRGVGVKMDHNDSILERM